MVGKEDKARIVLPHFLEGFRAMEFDLFYEVPLARQSESPDNELGERNKERVRPGRDESVGDVSEFQHLDSGKRQHIRAGSGRKEQNRIPVLTQPGFAMR